jgi:TPR repeat protein
MGHVRRQFCIAVTAVFLSGVGAAQAVSNNRTAIDQLNGMTDEQFQSLVKKAKTNDASAQTLLGIAYMRGVKVSRDDVKAMELFRAAAKKGNGIAEDNIGLFYFFGQGTTKNYAEAARWFKRAGEDGSRDAHYNLALMYHYGYGIPVDMDQAAKFYEVAAIEGDPQAQNTLGYLYQSGQGVAKDLPTAEKWYQRAAEQGLPNAQYNLANLYMGESKHQDALNWFLRAAKQGHGLAARSVAALNLHGHCMAINYREAYRWLLASQLADSWVTHTLATCKEHLTPKEAQEVRDSVKAGS